jgi:hypothetical protein
VKHAVADVAGISVAEQQMAERVYAGANPPTVKLLAVVRAERQLSGFEPGLPRRLDDLAAREVEHRVEQRADHPVLPSSAARARRASRRARRSGSGVRARRTAVRTTDAAVSRSVRQPAWTTSGRAPAAGSPAPDELAPDFSDSRRGRETAGGPSKSSCRKLRNFG